MGLVFWKGLEQCLITNRLSGDNPTARNRGQPSKHQGNWWIEDTRTNLPKRQNQGPFKETDPEELLLTSPRCRRGRGGGSGSEGGYINFDDLKGHTICDKDWIRC